MKQIIFVIIIVLAILAVCLAWRFLEPEDAWLCREGQWIPHGHPAMPSPTPPCQ